MAHFLTKIFLIKKTKNKKRVVNLETLCCTWRVSKYLFKRTWTSCRWGRRTVSPAIVIKSSTKVSCTSTKFIRNCGNKEELSKFISSWFKEWGIEVKIFEGKVDVEIVKKAIQFSQRSKEVVISSDDTYTSVATMPLARRFCNILTQYRD